MVDMKYAFAAVAVFVVAFVGVMLFAGKGSGQNIADMPIDESIPINAGEQVQAGAQVQEVAVRALASGGYDNPTVNVKAGLPVKFDFSADPRSGCGRQLIIDNVGVNLVSRNGETVSATFTPKTAGQYNFHCGMNMFRGVLVAS
ncbi:MAG: cupredoxin domain-containing protein [Candidatus Micrarchaeia archaeon]